MVDFSSDAMAAQECMGLPSDYKPEIHVVVNPEEKTLKFIDNGLGMTADEVEE